MALRYATVADLQEHVGGAEKLLLWTDDDQDGVGDDTIAERAIEKAADEVDAYLSARYACPLTTVPGTVKTVTLDIAVWNLTKRRQSATDAQRDAYEDAIRLLRDISAGRAALGVEPPPAAPEHLPGIFESEERVFTRTSLSGYL